MDLINGEASTLHVLEKRAYKKRGGNEALCPNVWFALSNMNSTTFVLSAKSNRPLKWGETETRVDILHFPYATDVFLSILSV